MSRHRRCSGKTLRHVHYRIAGRRFCRLECSVCGKVLDEGRVR